MSAEASLIETALELLIGNTSDAHALIEPCFQLLRLWRTKFSPILEFSDDAEFKERTLALPTMPRCRCILTRYLLIYKRSAIL